MVRFAPIAIWVFILVLAANTWRIDRRPRIFGEKIPRSMLSPQYHQLRKRIVMYHNFFRSRVAPPASNMLKMTWHNGAAKAAQRWAEECLLLVHDNITGRYDESYGQCGQNIFVATHEVPWFFAVKTWYLEKHNFKFGSKKNDLNTVGHYTQLVWASTHEVGCGFAKCQKSNSKKPFFNYVCNYCPIGNKPGLIGRPYRRGKRCSLCKDSCSTKKLCTNACPVADRWANCKEIYETWPTWLCHSPHTEKGKERRDSCKATCECGNKIH